MMASANNAQAVLKKKKEKRISQLLLFLRYEYVDSRQLRSEMAAAINGSNGYIRAGISSAQIRRVGGGSTMRQMPQLNFRNFSTSQGPYSV
jgi:hypothetical protein